MRVESCSIAEQEAGVQIAKEISREARKTQREDRKSNDLV